MVFIPHILVEVQFGEKKDEAEKGPPAFVNNSPFREESYSLSNLKEYEKKALAEVRAKVEEAIMGISCSRGRKSKQMQNH